MKETSERLNVNNKSQVWIEWTKEHWKKDEYLFINEIHSMRGYILQALHWLKQKPWDNFHSVTIWLSLELDDWLFNIEIKYEYEHQPTLLLFMEDTAKNKIHIGMVHINPLNTRTKAEEENEEKLIDEGIQRFFPNAEEP